MSYTPPRRVSRDACYEEQDCRARTVFSTGRQCGGGRAQPVRGGQPPWWPPRVASGRSGQKPCKACAAGRPPRAPPRPRRKKNWHRRRRRTEGRASAGVCVPAAADCLAGRGCRHCPSTGAGGRGGGRGAQRAKGEGHSTRPSWSGRVSCVSEWVEKEQGGEVSIRRRSRSAAAEVGTDRAWKAGGRAKTGPALREGGRDREGEHEAGVPPRGGHYALVGSTSRPQTAGCGGKRRRQEWSPPWMSPQLCRH